MTNLPLKQRCEHCGLDYSDPHDSHAWERHPKCPRCERATYKVGEICLGCLRRESGTDFQDLAWERIKRLNRLRAEQLRGDDAKQQVWDEWDAYEEYLDRQGL